MAPILALISYFVVDYAVKEVPHKLQNNSYYKLLVKSNCRWNSGHCTLTNGDVELNLSIKKTNNNTVLLLNSETQLSQVNVAVVKHIENQVQPDLMQNSGNNSYYYIMPVFSPSMYLQLSINIEESIFYTVIPLIFTKNNGSGA